MSKTTNPRHKLSFTDAVEMRRRALGGATVPQLAASYRVGKETVRSVLRYARYAPGLSAEHHARLAAAAPRLGLTRDDALAVVVERGINALLAGDSDLSGGTP